jgi:hypothetical protein
MMNAKFSTSGFPYVHVHFPGLPASVRRIPPRVETKVSVYITEPSATASTTVKLSVEDAGGTAGWATVEPAEVCLKGQSAVFATIKVTPGQQTPPGQPVYLVARGPGPRDVCKSNAFFICAYPVAMETAPLRLGHVKLDTKTPDGINSAYGLKVENRCISDSGTLADLGSVQVSEIVEYKNSDGCLRVVNAINSTYRPAATGEFTDFHSSTKNKMLIVTRASGNLVTFRLMEGSCEAHQLFIFRCQRSGVEGVVVPRSGFIIRKTALIIDKAPVDDRDVRKISFTVEEIGADVVAQGRAASAGRVVPTPRFPRALNEHLLVPPDDALAESSAFAMLADSARSMAEDKPIGAAEAYRRALQLLPQAQWSPRMREVDAVVTLLGEYCEALRAERMVAAGNLFRDAQQRLRGCGIAI